MEVLNELSRSSGLLVLFYFSSIWLKVYCTLCCVLCLARWQNPFRSLASDNVFVCRNAEISSCDWVSHFAVWPFCCPLVYSACSPRCDRTSEVLYSVHVPTAPIAVRRPKCHAGCSEPLVPPQDLSLHWSSSVALMGWISPDLWQK